MLIAFAEIEWGLKSSFSKYCRCHIVLKKLAKLLSGFSLILKPHKINGQLLLCSFAASITFEYFESKRSFELIMVNLNSKIVFKIDTINNILWPFKFCFALLNESLGTDTFAY